MVALHFAAGGFLKVVQVSRSSCLTGLGELLSSKASLYMQETKPQQDLCYPAHTQTCNQEKHQFS